MVLEQKLGALWMLLPMALGALLVYSLLHIYNAPIEVASYPYNQCLKVVTRDGEVKPCSWLESGQYHRIAYITNPQHGWVVRKEDR